jgi:DNA-directed RNA polymerase subunit RPC12/RpoP
MNTPEYDENGAQIEKPVYKWKYDCIDGNHSYSVASVVAPTCTEQGYTNYHCSVCNNDTVSDYVDELGHDYVLQGLSTTDYYVNYICSRCNQARSISAITLKNWFSENINDTAANIRYKRQFDLNQDGIINIRDYMLIVNQYNRINASLHGTAVNKNTTYQTMNGFGASACWCRSILAAGVMIRLMRL